MGKFGISLAVFIAILAFYGSQFVNVEYEMCRIIHAPLEDVFSFIHQIEKLPQIHPIM